MYVARKEKKNRATGVGWSWLEDSPVGVRRETQPSGKEEGSEQENENKNRHKE